MRQVLSAELEIQSKQTECDESLMHDMKGQVTRRRQPDLSRWAESISLDQTCLFRTEGFFITLLGDHCPTRLKDALPGRAT